MAFPVRILQSGSGDSCEHIIPMGLNAVGTSTVCHETQQWCSPVGRQRRDSFVSDIEGTCRRSKGKPGEEGAEGEDVRWEEK